MVKPNIHNVITKGSNPFKLKIILKIQIFLMPQFDTSLTFLSQLF